MGIRRQRFERLTWENGERQVVPPPPQSKEEEAVAALMALGGFCCTSCQKTLSALDGFTCCDQVYCPICGEAGGHVGGYHEAHCPHLVMRSHGGSLYLEAVSSATRIDPAIRSAVKSALRISPPAARLKAGKPIWSEEQIASVYGADAAYIPRLFGPDLRTLAGAHPLNEVLLEACLHPDLQTNVPASASRYDEYYFCSEPDQALARLQTWAATIEAGTKRLKAMPAQSASDGEA